MPRRGKGPMPAISSDVQHHRQQHEIEGRARISGAAQHGHDEGQKVRSRHGDEDDPEIRARQRQRVRRRAEQVEDGVHPEPAADGENDRNGEEEGGAGADDAPRMGEILRPHRLRHQDGRRHADTEHGAQYKEQNQVGVGGRRQRRFAEETADPYGIDRPVERLQHVRAEHRQREKKQRARDRAAGQVARTAACLCVFVHGDPIRARRFGSGDGKRTARRAALHLSARLVNITRI